MLENLGCDAGKGADKVPACQIGYFYNTEAWL